jgi:phage regulator Rha-like protein
MEIIMKNNFITNFVQVFNNELVVSHKIIAKQTKNKEENVSRLIRKYLEKLERFGAVGFEIQPKSNGNQGGDQPKIFYLNEQQATLLLTFMRNNEIVIEFKVRLVEEFFKMRETLKSQNSQPNQPVQTSHNFDLDSYISENEKLIKLIKLITSENAFTLHYLDKIHRFLAERTESVPYSYSPLELLGIDLNSYYFIPTELGKFFNKSAVEINKILEAKKYQFKENGVWQLTEVGKKYAIQLDNQFSTIKWKLESLV